MRILYTILTQIASFHLWLAQFFSKKLKLFVEGRKHVFKLLESGINASDKTIWFHCASLGEFEQAVPVIEAIKKEFPNHKIVLSFFSPSGYEIKKNTPLANVVCYLPMDTPGNARRFIKAVHPSMALFIKYEFWPNYLVELKKNNIPSLLISGVFRENQIFFKAYGGFMRSALHKFNHFFVQDVGSKQLLKQLRIENVTVSGDTRFDRVAHQIEQDNGIPPIAKFKGNSLCVVCGSTWPEDEQVLLEYINSEPKGVKFIVAPHKMDANKIAQFRKNLTQKNALYSNREDETISGCNVLIIDSIGLLTKIYSYADIAYVGGAMGTTGLHNILEPATFGVPVIIGQHYDKFPEAARLRQLAGLFSVNSASEFTQICEKLVTDDSFRSKTGMICEHYVNSNVGATESIMDYIGKLHRNGLV